MKTIRQITDEIVAREGGFVNDQDDPGGATKHGVTIGTMKRLGVDLDGDGDVDVADVRLVTTRLAADLFERHYFQGARIDLLPPELQPSVYDMNVNAGANAAKILQRLLAQYGRTVAVDGVIGPNTAAAVREVSRNAGARLFADAYGIARRNYYYRLGDLRPASRKYARRRDGGKGGWITRAEEFISARFHLTEAQHKARVARWD